MINVEDAVIGTLFREPHLLNDITIKPEHFQTSENRKTYEAMKQLKDEGKGIDIVTLLSVGDPKQIMSMSRLNDVGRLSNPNKIDTYIDMVIDKWREKEKRYLLGVASQENWSIERINGELAALIDDKTNDRKSMADLLKDVYESPWTPKVKVDSVNIGIESLQEITNGLRDSELTILAARPSMGKTDVMMHIAKSAGYEGRIPIVHSLEMSAELLRDRLIASEGYYNRYRMSDPHSLLSEKQKDRWVGALDHASKANIEIFDKARQSVSEIRMKTRKIRNENPDKKIIVLIDYLTLIRPNESSGNNVHHQVSDITKDLKEIAKEFDCPVVCLAQLSRGVEQRPDKRPMMSDLRESGGIEEAADVIAFLYRDAYYNEDTDSPNVMEINIAKQRNGATGTVFVDYEKTTGNLK